MKKLNINDVKAKFDTYYSDGSALTFETTDGTPVDWVETQDFKGFVTDDAAADMVNADILHTSCFDGVYDLYSEDENEWEKLANKQLADFAVKLGDLHGEYYDLLSI